jgi:hypothetical protein
MARDVFISHSAQDKKVAETICSALEESGIRCWVAPRDVRPGRAFPGEITRAIQQSKVMLMIFSRHSNSSEQVLREVQLAVDCRVPIVRLRIEDLPLSDDLRYYLSTPHWLDALTTPLSKHIPPVRAALKELLAQSPAEAEGATPGGAEVVVKNQPAAEGPRTAANWKLFGLGAILLAVVLVVALWAFRPEKKSGSAAPSAPTPRETAQPTPSPAPSPIVSAEPTPTPVTHSPAPSPTAPEKTPEAKPSPSAAEPNLKGPLPRKNRAWQPWMDEFVHNFIASNESTDIDLAVSFYAPTVDIFEEGRKSNDGMRRDIEFYNARWPSRRATIRGDVGLSEKAANHSYTASFEHDYYVENASRGEWINGAVAVDLQIIVDGDGIPRIVSMKQKTLRKDKGTMQRR